MGALSYTTAKRPKTMNWDHILQNNYQHGINDEVRLDACRLALVRENYGFASAHPEQFGSILQSKGYYADTIKLTRLKEFVLKLKLRIDEEPPGPKKSYLEIIQAYTPGDQPRKAPSKPGKAPENSMTGLDLTPPKQGEEWTGEQTDVFLNEVLNGADPLYSVNLQRITGRSGKANQRHWEELLDNEDGKAVLYRPVSYRRDRTPKSFTSIDKKVVTAHMRQPGISPEDTARILARTAEQVLEIRKLLT